MGFLFKMRRRNRGKKYQEKMISLMYLETTGRKYGRRNKCVKLMQENLEDEKNARNKTLESPNTVGKK